jgi:uncharacterized membrane protein YtjA (UPF0391 family)
MLHWTLIFFIISIVAGILGFRDVSSATSQIAKVLFFIFVIFFIGSLIMHLIPSKP